MQMFLVFHNWNVLVSIQVVGQVPRKISAVCYLGKTGSTITGMVIGLRWYSPDLPQGGDSGCMLDSMGNTSHSS